MTIKDFRTRSQDASPSAPALARMNSLACFAWLTVGYNVAVILWGAYVRTSGSGAGCGSRWPLCNGAILPSTSQSQTLIEFAHRATSAWSVVLVSVLVVWCWRRTSKGDWPRYSSLSALILLFNEALLGALLVLFHHVGLDPSAAHALFMCLHFGNTLLLLAALALTATWLSNPGRRFSMRTKPHETTAIGLGLLSVLVIGMTGSLASLGDTVFPPDSLRHALLQDFSSNSQTLLRFRLLHPLAAAAGSLYVLWLLGSLWGNQGRSRWSQALTVALTVQIALGVVNVLLLAPVWLQLSHLLVAETFWMLLVLASSDQLFAPRDSAVSLFPGRLGHGHETASD